MSSPSPARVVRIEPLTSAETLIEVAFDSDAGPGPGSEEFAPGRFVQVTIPGVGECPISLASEIRPNGHDGARASGTRASGMRAFDLCVRRAGLVTTAIHRLEVKERIGIRGPYGRGFPVADLAGRDLVIVAGGLGMAPLRSLVRWVLAHRDNVGETTLIYGTRSPADLLFREEVYGWFHGGRIRVLLSVDVAPAGDWNGIVGPVTVPLRRVAVDPARTSAFVVGPPVMFKYVLEELRVKGIPDGSIYCSLERRMHCGIGKCGQCQVEDLLACRDGPVFSVAQIGAREEAL